MRAFKLSRLMANNCPPGPEDLARPGKDRENPRNKIDPNRMNNSCNPGIYELLEIQSQLERLRCRIHLPIKICHVPILERPGGDARCLRLHLEFELKCKEAVASHWDDLPMIILFVAFSSIVADESKPLPVGEFGQER